MSTQGKPDPVLMIICLVMVIILLKVLQAHPEWRVDFCGCR